MFVCLEIVLGLLSAYAFWICEIEISFLHLLLLPGTDPNPEAAPVWHKFLAKAIMECAYCSENDREHAANVTRTLRERWSPLMVTGSQRLLCLPVESCRDMIARLCRTRHWKS
jgi:hypothetical protein